MSIKARVTQAFGKLPRGDYRTRLTRRSIFQNRRSTLLSRQSPTNYAQGIFNARASARPIILNAVATAILASLVYREVRAKRQLSYGAGRGPRQLHGKYGQHFRFVDDVNQSVRVMLEQINLLKTYSLNDEVISEVSGNFLTSYYLSQETSGAQAGELAKYEIVGGGWRNYYKFLDGIKQVKAADVKDVANRYMKNLRFVVVGDPAAVNRSIFVPN